MKTVKCGLASNFACTSWGYWGRRLRGIFWRGMFWRRMSLAAGRRSRPRSRLLSRWWGWVARPTGEASRIKCAWALSCLGPSFNSVPLRSNCVKCSSTGAASGIRLSCVFWQCAQNCFAAMQLPLSCKLLHMIVVRNSGESSLCS